MQQIKFTIPGRLPGMNEYQAACRRHRMEKTVGAIKITLAALAARLF